MEIKKAPLVTPSSIYNHLKHDICNIEDNPFEVGTVNKPFNEFSKNYLPEEYEAHESGYELLIEIISAAEENAFKVGFNIAKGLLMQ